jgi:Transposase DDE domain
MESAMPAIAKKARFSVRNWRQYNESLVARGSITLWFSGETLRKWYHENGAGKRGQPFTYSDSTMELFLSIRELLRLPYRQTEGFVRGMFTMVANNLHVPDFMSAAKRAAKLGVALPVLPRRGHIDVVLDSTGLKVFGEGEWKVRQHGPSKRRTWRKLHLAIDPDTQEIVAEVLTTNAGHDADQADALLDEAAGKINSVTADGGYDKWKVYETIERRGARPKIPPRHDAKIKRHANTAGPRLARDEAIRMIRRIGRKSWKKHIGYHCRSLVETAVFRLKTIFGPMLKNRKLLNQCTEARLRCKILNQFTRSGLLYTHPN